MAEVEIPIVKVSDLDAISEPTPDMLTIAVHPTTGVMSSAPFSSLKNMLMVENGLNVVSAWTPSNIAPSPTPNKNDSWIVKERGSTNITGVTVSANVGDQFFWNGSSWQYLKYSDNTGQVFVGSVSDVRLISDIIPTVIITKGFGGKYGGGYWLPDYTDTTTVDDTGTCIVTTSGIRIKRQFDLGVVYASWFGAYPFYDKGTLTGVDCAPYVQKAIDYLLNNGGGCVCFEPGDWYAGTRFFINTNEQIPITLRGSAINISYSQTGTSIKGDTFFTSVTDGLCRVGIKENGDAFYTDDNFLYKCFGVENISFKGENALTGIIVFKTHRTRTVMRNVSATHCDWVVYQPDTTADGKGNYCDGSSYENVKVYNPRLGGLYLYKSDSCRITDFKYEASTSLTQKGIVITGASGVRIDGIILGGNADVPDLIPGSCFIDIINCQNTIINPEHFEHCYFEHCIRIRDNSRNTTINGMYMKFEHRNAITFSGLVESVRINGWFSFGVGPLAGYYDLNAIHTSTDDITITMLNLKDASQIPRNLVKNGAINTTQANDNNLLTTESIILPRAINELVRGFAYGKAQLSMSGGGQVSYDASVNFNLKWTARFLAPMADKILGSTGYLEFLMPTVGTIIQGLGTTLPITVTSSGIPFVGGWNFLIAEHNSGSAGTIITYKVGVFGTMGTNTLKSNQIIIAVRNNDNNSIRLGTGQMMVPGSIIINGKLIQKSTIQEIVNTDTTINLGVETVILNKGGQVNGVARTLTLQSPSLVTGQKIEFYNYNSGAQSFALSLPLTDRDLTTITTLPNQSVITIFSDGSIYRISDKYL